MRWRFEFTPDLSKFRQHQAGAYHKIVERILDGEDTDRNCDTAPIW